jgi:hypothetical protein
VGPTVSGCWRQKGSEARCGAAAAGELGRAAQEAERERGKRGWAEGEAGSRERKAFLFFISKQIFPIFLSCFKTKTKRNQSLNKSNKNNAST